MDIDGEGMALARCTKATSARRTSRPLHQFPIGISMPIGRRIQLLNWAQERGAYLIEDDYDSEFATTCAPSPRCRASTLARAWCTWARFPNPSRRALRISYMIAAAAAVDGVRGAVCGLSLRRIAL